MFFLKRRLYGYATIDRVVNMINRRRFYLLVLATVIVYLFFTGLKVTEVDINLGNFIIILFMVYLLGVLVARNYSTLLNKWEVSRKNNFTSKWKDYEKQERVNINQMKNKVGFDFFRDGLMNYPRDKPIRLFIITKYCYIFVKIEDP